MRPPGMKGDRDLVGIERSLGLRSSRGISRQANKDAPPIRSLLEGIRIIAQAYVTRSNGEIRSSQVLKDDAHDLLEQYGPEIWPPPEVERPAWLEEPSTTNFDGKYPQHRYYTNPADREFLNNTFYQLVVEKCCNYHDNQLQKHRRTSAKNHTGQDNSASGTPRQGEYPDADEAESETEFVTAHAPPSWPAVNDPVTRRFHPSGPPPALAPSVNHHSPAQVAPHGLPGVYVFGQNGHAAPPEVHPGAVREMSPMPEQRRPSQFSVSRFRESQGGVGESPVQQVPQRDRDGDEVLPDAPPAPPSVNGEQQQQQHDVDEENGDYANGRKRKHSVGSILSDVTSKRSRMGSVDDRPSLWVTLKANPDELIRISKRTKDTLYNNKFLDYYTRDSSPEETSSRRSVRSLRSERQSTIHSTPGPETKKPVIQVQLYKDRKGKWYEVDGEGRPPWAVDEKTATKPAPPAERRRSAWVKRHGPISPSSVNAPSEIGLKTRGDDAHARPRTQDGPAAQEDANHHDEAHAEQTAGVNGRKASEAGQDEMESTGKSGLLSPSKSPRLLQSEKPDHRDNAHHQLLNAVGEQTQAPRPTQHEPSQDRPPPSLTAPSVAPFGAAGPNASRKTSSSPISAPAGFRPSEPPVHASPRPGFVGSDPPRFAAVNQVSRPPSSGEMGPQQLQHVFKARSSEQPPAGPGAPKSRLSSVSEYAPPLSIVRARDSGEEERAQAQLGAFRPSVNDGQFIQFALPQQGKEAGDIRREEKPPQDRVPPRKPAEHPKASATPEMASVQGASPSMPPHPHQPNRALNQAAGAGAPPAPKKYATPKALVEEVMGNLALYPTVQHMLTTFPTLSRVELENLRLILSNDVATRNDWRALFRYLRVEIMYGPLESIDFRILQQYVYSDAGHPPPPELAPLFSKQGGPPRSLPSNAAVTPRMPPAVPTEQKLASQPPKPEVVRPLTIQSIAPVVPSQPQAPPPAAAPPAPMHMATPAPAFEPKKSEPPDSKAALTGVEDESLNNTYIEVNWGVESVDFNDYMSMQDFQNCRDANDFFSRIEAKIPSELQREGRQIREIRVKAMSELKPAPSRMPRFLRDESAVKGGWRQLVKILRSQASGTEAELEFMVIWAER